MLKDAKDIGINSLISFEVNITHLSNYRPPMTRSNCRVTRKNGAMFQNTSKMTSNVKLTILVFSN